ncbi:MAG: hypothetical protein LBN21_12550 [Treponema sp.]|jgi:hypothetical protein|nr:hypothetical protein [Treponema sp.]
MFKRNGFFLLFGMGLFFLSAAFLPAQAPLPGSGILTNARDGGYGGPQKFWFSVPQGERLRVLVNALERYRGESAAAIDLDVPAGEELDFRITAERYSPPPDNRILETRSFLITIDKKPPPPPDVKIKTVAGGRIVLVSEAGQGVKVQACVDTGAAPVFVPDLASSPAFAPGAFSAIVWAVDSAGNASAPVTRSFDFPGVRVENPAPGRWANPQRLIISGAQGKDVFWTADGSDPAGENGIRYTVPALIERTGEVTLRIAYRDAGGYVQEEKINYRVEGRQTAYERYSDPANLQSLFEPLRVLEGREIRENTAIALPENVFWSVGGLPRDLRGRATVSGGNGLVLRPVPAARRIVALHLSQEHPAGTAGESILYRFVFTLNGIGTEMVPEKAGADSGERTVDNIFYTEGGAPAPGEEAGNPRIVQTGRSRVVVFSSAGGIVRYIWNSAAVWSTGNIPACIAAEGGTLRWIIDQGDSIRGPFTAAIPPMPARTKPADPAQGRYAWRYASIQNRNPFEKAPLGEEWRYVSELTANKQSGAEKQFLDACDGEDIEWRFISANGESLATWRTDRLLPLPPVLSAPSEASWQRGPVRVSAESREGDEDAQLVTAARLRYASGMVQAVQEKGPLFLASGNGEYAEVHLEAWLEDSAGNKGPPAIRNFILDPLTVYVSASGTPGQAADLLSDEGSRDKPFSSLEAAIEFAVRAGRKNIYCSGALQLRKSITFSGDFCIDGSFTEKWERGKGRGAIAVLPGVTLTAQKGTLTLRSLNLERRQDGAPLVQVQQGAHLEIENSYITLAGPFLGAEGAVCAVRDSRIISLMTTDRRIPAAQVRNSHLSMVKTKTQLEGGNGLILEMSGGVLEITESEFNLDCLRTGTVFSLTGVDADFNNIKVSAAAGDYCSGLEIRRSKLTMNGGSFSVSARDAAAVITDAVESIYIGSSFALKTSFAAKAFTIRNTFPHFTRCTFISSGTSRRSEVFSAAQLVPPALIIAENVFQGFTYILGDAWPIESLAGFNRRFAPPNRPNIQKARQ